MPRPLNCYKTLNDWVTADLKRYDDFIISFFRNLFIKLLPFFTFCGIFVNVVIWGLLFLSIVLDLLGVI